MKDRTRIDAEYEAIKAESVEKVRKALKVITNYARLFDASGNITEVGRKALGEVEGLDLFWIVDPMITLAKDRPQGKTGLPKTFDGHSLGEIVVKDNGICKIVDVDGYAGYTMETIMPKEAFVEAYNKYIKGGAE